jgi:hypothetical protein
MEVERIGTSHGLSMLPSLPKPFRIADIAYRLQPSPALQPEQTEDEDDGGPAPRSGARAPLRLKA